MCGISGYYSVKKFFKREDLLSMVNVQRHRGPDAEGIFEENFVGLGHNRLSIIDLSEKGNQPMISSDNRFVIVFNGEIYNYKQLRNELLAQRKSFQFISETDTEVILEWYIEIGNEIFSKLNGMFSIAIFDRLKQELVIARDRFGIKPLFYFWDGQNLAFSSELKALKSIDGLELSINKLAIPHYLHLGFIPAPFSIYSKCYKLEPGCCLSISNDQISKESFAQVNYKLSQETAYDSSSIIANVSQLLNDSVEAQMNCDVPFGVFLSGGIDSSLLTSKAVELSKTKINTFTIGFDDLSQDESAYAREIAKHLGTNHHELILNAKDAIDTLETYLSIYDEPFSDSSGIPTLLVSKLAAKEVKVVLSGEGADELFLGYGSYKWASRMNNPFIWNSRKLFALLLNLINKNRFKRVSRLFDVSSKESIRSHIFSQEQYYFSEAEIIDLINPEKIDLNYLVMSNKFTDNELSLLCRDTKISAIDEQSLYDLKYYLPDDLLVKVDRAGMKHSLETRVPYLDNNLVDYLTGIPGALKIQDGPKFILREILKKYVPSQLFDRPKKGFSVPMKNWLKNELKPMVQEFLSENNVKKEGLFDYNYILNLLKRFENGEDYLSQRIWLLLNLHIWLSKRNL